MQYFQVGHTIYNQLINARSGKFLYTNLDAHLHVGNIRLCQAKSHRQIGDSRNQVVYITTLIAIVCILWASSNVNQKLQNIQVIIHVSTGICTTQLNINHLMRDIFQIQGWLCCVLQN